MKQYFTLIFFVFTASTVLASSFDRSVHALATPISYQKVVNGMALKKEGYCPSDVIICLAGNANLYAAPDGTEVKVGERTFFKKGGRWTTFDHSLPRLLVASAGCQGQ